MSVGKSFRAALPSLRGDQMETLRRWSLANCASTVLLHDSGGVTWLATRERSRTAAAHMRSARATLKKLLIDTRSLRGRWLVLASDDVVRAEAAARCAGPPRGNTVNDDTRDGRFFNEDARDVQLFSNSAPRGVPTESKEHEDGSREVRLSCTQQGGRRSRHSTPHLDVVKEE